MTPRFGKQCKRLRKQETYAMCIISQFIVVMPNSFFWRGWEGTLQHSLVKMRDLKSFWYPFYIMKCYYFKKNPRFKCLIFYLRVANYCNYWEWMFLSWFWINFFFEDYPKSGLICTFCRTLERSSRTKHLGRFM